MNWNGLWFLSEALSVLQQMGIQVFLMKALVTGGTGPLGGCWSEGCLEKGFWCQDFFVRASSDISCFDDLSGRFEVFRGTSCLKRICAMPASECIDIVFHLAAKLHINRPSISAQKEIYRSTLIQQGCFAGRSGKHVKRLVFFSTINRPYVSDGKQIFDENLVPSPLTAYSRSKLMQKTCSWSFIQGRWL